MHNQCIVCTNRSDGHVSTCPVHGKASLPLTEFVDSVGACCSGREILPSPSVAKEFDIDKSRGGGREEAFVHLNNCSFNSK